MMRREQDHECALEMAKQSNRIITIIGENVSLLIFFLYGGTTSFGEIYVQTGMGLNCCPDNIRLLLLPITRKTFKNVSINNVT